MKSNNFTRPNKIRIFIVSLLAVFACLFTGLGINGFAGADTTSTTDTQTPNKIVAWYKFESAARAHLDYCGNYTLTAHSSMDASNERGDGLAFDVGETACMAYADTAEQNPLTYYATAEDKSFTISMLYYTGTTGGGANRILSSTVGWQGFAISHGWSNINVDLDASGYYKARFNAGAEKWIRLTISYDGTTLSTSCYNVTDNADITGCYMVLNPNSTSNDDKYMEGSTATKLTWTDSNYDISSHGTDGQGSDGFVIGNKGNYGFTQGQGAGFGSDYGQKIADLRFYAGVVDAYELYRIKLGDMSRASNSNGYLQYAYRPFSNKDVTLDQVQVGTQRNVMTMLNTGSITYDDNEMAAVFSNGEGLLYAVNHGYINAVTNTTIKNDFSDYMRNSPFTFSIRAKLISATDGSNNQTYYVFSTGSYVNSFCMAVSYGNVEFYLGKGYKIETNTSSLYPTKLQFKSVLTTGRYDWVRATVTYDGSVFTGTVYNETTGVTYDSPTWYYELGSSTVPITSYTGGSFGGYDYDVAIGGQSNFGDNNVAFCYNDIVGRNGVKISRLDVFSRVISDNQKKELNKIDDGSSLVYASADSFTKVAHYEFNDANNLGYDTTGNHHLVNAGGVTKSSEGDGVVLSAKDNASGTAATQSNAVLYSPALYRTSGADGFDRYRGNMTVSFRAKLKTMTGEGHALIGNSTEKGFWIGVEGSTIVVWSNGTKCNSESVLGSTEKWYRITLKFNFSSVGGTGSLELSVITWDIDNKVSKSVSHTCTSTDFGGSYDHTMTIGGLIPVSDSTKGNKGVEGGASDGSFNPVISDVRIYTGIINDAEVTAINDADAAKMKLDTTNSLINFELNKSLAINYWIKLTGGTNPWFYVSYNTHKYEIGYGSEWVTMPNNSGQGTKINFSAMALQDMNDEIVITGGYFKYQEKNYDMNLNGWSRCTVNVRSYMQEIINTYGETSTAGKQAIYMLNLGAAAQRTVGHDTGDLANKNLTASQQKMTGWTTTTASAGGHLKTNQIWKILEEGNGKNDIIDIVAISPEYDNHLGFVILIDTVTPGASYTVQFCDSTGAVLQTFSSADGLQDSHVDCRKYYITGGILTIGDLAKEYRVKIIANGVQQYRTVSFNFLHFVSEYYSNRGDSTVLQYIYSLYEMTL